MEYSVVIVASGQGTRMKLGYNKVFYKINDHQTILDCTIACFKQDSDCKQIIVVINEDELHLISNEGIDKTIGGTLRQDSVLNGLKLVKYPYVLIHDGARPQLKLAVLDRLKKTLVEKEACLLMIPCKDTITIVEDGICKKTLDRSTLYQAQTPQAFKTSLIREAFSQIKEGEVFTDDASIVQQKLLHPVYMVLGDEANFKVTTSEDLKNLG